jgi:hypothetical protein
MKQYIEAPQYSVEIDRLPARENIFLAGSITGAQDWQKELAYTKSLYYGRIIDLFNVFNPRRANYNALDPALELEQITWEYHCIHKKCEHILFWFAPETLAPITLFELGSALNTHDHGKIYIGIDPEYKRKNDVIIQTQLRNKTLANRIVYSKQDLLEQITKTNS